MKHSASAKFWARYHALPGEISELADKAFKLLKSNPSHPSLQFKKLGEVWSARVGLHYRALAIEEKGGYLWFWIGTHGEYDKLRR